MADNLAPERERTNESLRTEREKTDQAVRAKQEDVAKHADAVVDRARDDADEVLSLARENADTVLEVAREKADEILDPAACGLEPKAAIIEERARADAALRNERDGADEALRLEREEYARTLVRFLPLERESTDRYLLTERNRSDDALANRDDFLAIVAHDLRDLIGGVVMSAAVVSKRAPQNEDGAGILAETKRIERYAARMNRLLVSVRIGPRSRILRARTSEQNALGLAEADALAFGRPAAWRWPRAAFQGRRRGKSSALGSFRDSTGTNQ